MLILQSLAVLAIITIGLAWLIGASRFYKALRVGGTSARDYERRPDTGLKGLGVGVKIDLLVAAWPIVVALPERHRVRVAAWSAVDPWDGRWPGNPPQPVDEDVYDHLASLLAIALQRLDWSVSLVRGECDDGMACFVVGADTEMTFFSPGAAKVIPDELIVRKTVDSLRSGGTTPDLFLGGLAEEYSMGVERLDG